MARVNLSRALKASTQLAKRNQNRKDGVIRTDASRNVQDSVEDYIASRPGSEVSNMLLHIRRRLMRKGDDFQRVPGYGQFAEALSAVFLGLYTSKKDIEGFQVFDSTPYWEEGDLVFLERLGDRVINAQVKGEGGSINWRGPQPLGSSIGIKASDLNDKGMITAELPMARKKQILHQAIMSYIRQSPDNLRIVSPIYKESISGVFDMGAETFLQVTRDYPQAFSFELDKKKSPYIGTSRKQAMSTWLAELQSGEDLTELKKIARTSFGKEEKELIAAFNRLLDEYRVAHWEAYGKLRFNYKAAPLATSVSPLINTGIKLDEDKTPFYDLLKQLYPSATGSKSNLPQINYYLEYNPKTKPNKLPGAYYTGTYYDIRY